MVESRIPVSLRIHSFGKVFLEDEAEPDAYHELLSLQMDAQRVLKQECELKKVDRSSIMG